MTVTTTLTPVTNTALRVYPNPADGTEPVTIRLPYYSGLSDVKIQIFTIAFRKVQEKVYPSQVWGLIPIQLVDIWNKPLASGLYYVVVITNEGRSVAKLLIIR